MVKEKNKLEVFLYNSIYSSIVFSLSYLCGLPIGVKLALPLQILIVFGITIIVKLFFIYPIILFILMAIVLLALIIISYFFKSFPILLFRRILFLLKNIYYHVRETEIVQPENTLIFWGIIIVSLSIFTWYVIFKSKHPLILLPIYVGGTIYYWYIYYDAAYWMLALFLFLFFILLGLKSYSKERENTNKRFTDAFHYYYKSKIDITITYSLIIIALALVLPKSTKYISWQWLKETTYESFPFLKDFRSSESVRKASTGVSRHTINIVGYSNVPTKLGGPIVLNDKAVMNVEGEGPVYLRGNIRHTYTGTHWATENNDVEHYELMEDFSGLSDMEKEKYYKERTYLIINRTLTDIIFSPYKPSMVSFESIYRLKVNQDDILSFTKDIDIGDRYTVTVLESLQYDELVSLGIDRKKEDIENISIYLQLPDTITNSTRKLVKEIVEDLDTDYEKAQAIERYLRENYRYTLEVDVVPEGYDFIDYFLFHSKEGYCTYYATAMAIMLRLEGIPTRYVEGYLAHEAREEGRYVVRNNNAHSWVEAFIEPIGWMTFEPTPAYPLPSASEGFEFEEVKETEEDIRNAAVERNVLDDIMLSDTGREKEDTLEGQKLVYRIESKDIILILSLVLLTIPIKFIVRFIKVKYQDIKISKMPNKEKLIYLYNEILKLIELRGIFPQVGETHFEFANRIAYNFPLMADERGIEDITEIFVRNKYSSHPASDKDVAIMEEYKRTMEKRIRNFLGLRIYLYRRYLK